MSRAPRVRRKPSAGDGAAAPWPSLVVHSLPDRVAQMVLTRIASGELPPGSRLPSQRDIAERCGVGLAVVREALQRLAALNVVEAAHGSGTVVRPFRWTPILNDSSLATLAIERIGLADLWETRRLLEEQIILLAVERRTAKALADVADVLRRADPLPTSYEDSLALNREFHLAVARASGNFVLEDLLAPLLDIVNLGAAHRFTDDIRRKTWAAHWAIHDAIQARSADAARDAVRAHFLIGPISIEEIDARAKHVFRGGRRSRSPRTQET